MDIVRVHYNQVVEHSTPLLILPVYEENDSTFSNIINECVPKVKKIFDSFSKFTALNVSPRKTFLIP